MRLLILAIISLILFSIFMIGHPAEKKEKKLMYIMWTTAYNLDYQSCGKWAKYNKTATGIKPRKGVCAVDPNFIPLHTRMYVQKYGYCFAEDVGSAIKNEHIDLFMLSREDAIRWGRKKVKVWVVFTEQHKEHFKGGNKN